MKAFSEGGHRRMRLNVVAHLSNQVAARFLVVVDEDDRIETLYTKVHQSLQRSGVYGTIAEVRNSFQAMVPIDYALGDIFRDGEEVVVILRGEDGQLFQERIREVQGTVPTALRRGERAADSSPSRRLAMSARSVPSEASMLRVSRPEPERPELSSREPGRMIPVTAHVTLPRGLRPDDDSEEDDDCPLAPAEDVPLEDYPPLPRAPEGPNMEAVPGPVEQMEMEQMPYQAMKVDHPCEPVQLNCYDDDWLVEHLTPRLRDFIMQRFQPDLVTEPKYVASIGKYVGAKFLQSSGAFVSVFMRPQTALRSDPGATLPVHYNIPKSELNMFQRKVESHIEELLQHQELIHASLRALQQLLAKGMAESDVVNVMMPVDYHAFQEVEGAMIEADQPLLPVADGRRPVVIIDTSAAVAEHLFYVKAGVKRALHVHMPKKESFQMVRFDQRGEPRLWAQDMMAPTELALQKAEDWVDQLVPVERSNLVEAVRFALSFRCDEIYIISSASFRQIDHEKILATIRFLNKREAAIHAIGVEPDAHGELLLRNISEGNHGDFTLKSFRDQGIGTAIPGQDSKWTSWRTILVNQKAQEMSNSFKQQTMTIGSQIRVLEVLLREEGKFETAWREEKTCVVRLLSKVQENPDRDMVKELERRTTQTVSARVGGGFLYHAQQVELGMEKLFEHKSSMPWSAQSDCTVAIGPKVPRPDVEQRRAKFPPSSEELPLAPEEMPQPPDCPKAPPACPDYVPPKERRCPPCRLRRATGSHSRSGLFKDTGVPCPDFVEEPRRKYGAGNPWATERNLRLALAYASKRSPKCPRRRSEPRLKRGHSIQTKTVSARVGGGFVYQTQVCVPRPSSGRSPPVTVEVDLPRRRPEKSVAYTVAYTAPPSPLPRRWSF